VKTSESDDGVVVEISDTGTGMSPDTVRQIFTPFFTTKPLGVGTGLGLSIAHRIVSSLGGALHVDTAPGRGTTFRVVLPTAHREEPVAAAPLLAVAATRRARILVVDDEPMITTTIRRMLHEHDVVTANRALDALDRVRAGERFELVLCDVMMPQMSGLDLYREIHAIDAELASRIVFLTGGAFTPAARTFLDEIPNTRLDKPFDPARLRAVVQEVLEP
jgi:CheY-like chemotaxis protein